MPKRMRVKCIETGLVYDSCKKVIEEFHIDGKSLWRCFKKSSRTAGGYHWKEMAPLSNKPRKKKKKVYGMQRGNIPTDMVEWRKLGTILDNKYLVFVKENLDVVGKYYIKTCLAQGFTDKKANFSLELNDVAYQGFQFSDTKELAVMKRYYPEAFDAMFELIKKEL